MPREVDRSPCGKDLRLIAEETRERYEYIPLNQWVALTRSLEDGELEIDKGARDDSQLIG